MRNPKESIKNIGSDEVQLGCGIWDRHIKVNGLLRTSNEQPENGTKKTIPFTMASKITKY